MKLSPLQLEVLRLVSVGWELGVSSLIGGDNRTTIQYGGLGKGGATRIVNRNTFNSLLRLKLIAITRRSHPQLVYGITKLGTATLKEHGL
jgi:hypothetical protein